MTPSRYPRASIRVWARPDSACHLSFYLIMSYRDRFALLKLARMLTRCAYSAPHCSCAQRRDPDPGHDHVDSRWSFDLRNHNQLLDVLPGTGRVLNERTGWMRGFRDEFIDRRQFYGHSISYDEIYFAQLVFFHVMHGILRMICWGAVSASTAIARFARWL